MRIAFLLVSLSALFVGYVEAPQLHIHEGRYGTTVHAHLPEAEARHTEPGFSQERHDSSAQSINLTVACQTPDSVLLAIGTATEIVVTPPIRWTTAATPCTQSHDPPNLEASHPRPPPSQAAAPLLNS